MSSLTWMPFDDSSGPVNSSVRRRNLSLEADIMSMWMYQINQRSWSPQRYRLEIWERERWAWPVGNMAGAGKMPEPGDTVVFFYAPSGGIDPGFYGWAVILEWLEGTDTQLYFRPVAPSDHLKMHPWWDSEAHLLADDIRGRMKQRTLWIISDDLATRLRRGITSWIAGVATIDLEAE